MRPTTRVFALPLAALSVGLSLVLSGGAASPAAAGPEEPKLLTFHGKEAKAVLPIAKDRLPGVGKEFRRFVRGQLHRLWDGLENTPGCKTSPMITVDRLRTDGFAMGSVHTRPRPDCETGGGYAAIWAIRDGAWKEVIGTQEVVQCWRLKKFDIPSEIGVHECWKNGEVVPYEHD